VITVRPQAKDSPVFGPIMERNEKYMPPKWLKVDARAGRIEVMTVPEAGDAEQAVDMRQVVEFYSRN
jgi:hypothetical protein